MLSETELEKRMDIIGQNGNEGLHYDIDEDDYSSTTVKIYIVDKAKKEQVGVAEACLDMALAYVLERQQFGRPIASFQAIKHRCAQMLVEVESARSAVYGAACLADILDDAAGLLVSAAQARVTATEAAQFCARENLQLHGGVGFTWEYDPHFYLRRAQASSQRLGPVSEWLESVAALNDTAE